MVTNVHNKSVIVICDCIGCKNRPTWRQGFATKKGIVVVDLCEEHHFILRTKVLQNILLDGNVLKWLLMQDANHYKVIKYGIVMGIADIAFLKELDKIDLELE